MRDYILSLTLLAIFLGAYTALVISFGKPVFREPAAQINQPATQQVAEPSPQD